MSYSRQPTTHNLPQLTAGYEVVHCPLHDALHIHKLEVRDASTICSDVASKNPGHGAEPQSTVVLAVHSKQILIRHFSGKKISIGLHLTIKKCCTGDYGTCMDKSHMTG